MVKRDYDQLDQMGVQMGLEGAFLVEGFDSRLVYFQHSRQLLQQAVHHASLFAVCPHRCMYVQLYIPHALVQYKRKFSRLKTVTQQVCLQSSGDPFEMFNTFFGGGGMGGMGGSGQQKFKVNMGGGGMGGGGMGGGGMGGGGIEELLMGGMCICHATCCAVLSIMCRASLWYHDVLLHHVTKSGHGAIVKCSHPSQADHTSLHTRGSITMHLTAVIMLQAEAWLAHFTAHT